MLKMLSFGSDMADKPHFATCQTTLQSEATSVHQRSFLTDFR